MISALLLLGFILATLVVLVIAISRARRKDERSINSSDVAAGNAADAGSYPGDWSSTRGRRSHRNRGDNRDRGSDGGDSGGSDGGGDGGGGD